MKIRRLVFHRGLWILAVALMLLVALTLLQWATAPSISQINVIVYPLYTSSFSTLFLVVFGLAWVFSLLWYAQAKQLTKAERDKLFFIAFVLGLIFLAVFAFWPAIGILIGVSFHLFTVTAYRNTLDRGLWLVLGIILFLCFLIALNPIPPDLQSEDTAHLDGRTYHVARYFQNPPFDTNYIFYRCDRWGVVCQHLYLKTRTLVDILEEEDVGTLHLQTDPASHTVFFMLNDEILYTDYTGE